MVGRAFNLLNLRCSLTPSVDARARFTPTRTSIQGPEPPMVERLARYECGPAHVAADS